MDVLNIVMPFERHLCEKADGLRIPIAATAEIIPLCNMDCKMCYVKMSSEKMKREGNLLTVDEWMKIFEEAQQQGLLFLLLTGGEPLLYPGFKELYKRLKKLGLIICINTNGTLINEEWADFFAEDPPRRINISIYGASDEKYKELCGNSRGFSQMMRGVKLLKERGIDVKWNYSVTRLNCDDLEAIYKIAKENNIYLETAYYMFPPVRRADIKRNIDTIWLSSQDAAKVRIIREINDLGEQKFSEKCNVVTAVKNKKIKIKKPDIQTSFTCRAGTSVFWINWKGEMVPCGMLGLGNYNICKEGFYNCWNEIKEWVKNFKHPRKCTECQYETFCVRCAAASYAEEQDFEKEPQYICELMQWYLKYMEDISISNYLPRNIDEFENLRGLKSQKNRDILT